MCVLSAEQIRGIHHIRGARSVPSVGLRFGGRDRRLDESLSIAVASAQLHARQRLLAARRRVEGGGR